MEKDNKHIALIGFSGSGKSTVGPALAKKLKYEFVDLDCLIEKKQKKTINEIFDLRGERFFRELETKLLDSVLKQNKNTVIALGGGAYQKLSNRKQIKRNALVVYLSCSQKEIYNRLKFKKDRPLLFQNANDLKSKIKSLLASRINNYKKADITVSTTDKSINEIVTVIIKKYKNANR